MQEKQFSQPQDATVTAATVRDIKAEAETTSDSESDPPSYDATESHIPLDIVSAFSNLTLESEKHPAASECIAHLKLLEAFHELREQIGHRDGLYGIWDRFADQIASVDDRRKVMSKIREKRWALYAVQAVRRFERWFERIDRVRDEPAVPFDVHPAYQKCSDEKMSIQFMESRQYSDIHKLFGPLRFHREDLPPLDVLMVWHTFCLNPRDFFSDCIRHNRMSLWQIGMPWGAIVTSIDNYSFAYDPGETAHAEFTKLTELPWDNVDMPMSVSIPCPACAKTSSVPFTTCNDESHWSSAPRAGESGAGYADSGFMIRCACYCAINHKVLRGHRFCQDVRNLRTRNVPMPGTLLNARGYTKQCQNFFIPGVSCYLTSFPNRLLRGRLGLNFANSDIKPYTILNCPVARTVSDIRKVIEEAAETSPASTVATERVAIRRMMSCYWENASIFSLDLVGAVIRQGLFVEKMHHIDWLHSPALRTTMERLILKYQRFIYIMAQNPERPVVVPTLDVDLAWHTHQLSPPDYRAYGIKHTGKLVNHDDKIDESTLSNAFEWTSKMYQKLYGSVYAECTCWYCEAIREAHHPRAASIFSPSSIGDTSRLHTSTATDPLRSPHISAHSAIKSETPSISTARHVQHQRLERNYQKAVQRAKKERREPPSRDTYYSAWGYDYPMLYYAPYMGNPCLNSGMYPSKPDCASYVAGAEGNCCSGTCGGPVAGGGCSGGGGGGCSGGCSSCGGCGG